MRLGLLIAVAAFQVVFRLAGFDIRYSVVVFSLASSVIVLASLNDFESLARDLTKNGVNAVSPASLPGKSGVKHQFAFAVCPPAGRTKLVVDTVLSVSDVDEMKVLAFYVKVFDVLPEKAILAVSPRLSNDAQALAKEYNITVLENESPRKLVPMVAEEARRILESSKAA